MLNKKLKKEAQMSTKTSELFIFFCDIFLLNFPIFLHRVNYHKYKYIYNL